MYDIPVSRKIRALSTHRRFTLISKTPFQEMTMCCVRKLRYFRMQYTHHNRQSWMVTLEFLSKLGIHSDTPSSVGTDSSNYPPSSRATYYRGFGFSDERAMGSSMRNDDLFKVPHVSLAQRRLSRVLGPRWSNPSTTPAMLQANRRSERERIPPGSGSQDQSPEPPLREDLRERGLRRDNGKDRSRNTLPRM